MLSQRTHSTADLQQKMKKPLWISLSLCVVLSLAGCASKPSVYSKSRIQVPLYYTVKSGDTLGDIGQRYGLSYLDIAELNGIEAPYRIYVNQSLKLKADGRSPARAISVQPLEVEAPIQRQTVTTPTITTTPVQPTQTAQNQQTQNLPNTTATPATTASTVPPTNTNTVTHYSGIAWKRPSNGPVIEHYNMANDVKGTRFGGQVGDPVLAAASGDVLYASDGLKEYGNLVLIRHVDGYITAYAHNSQLLVKNGDKVSAGQKIALMGSSGTNKVMLEFQVRLSGKPINPKTILPNI